MHFWTRREQEHQKGNVEWSEDFKGLKKRKKKRISWISTSSPVIFPYKMRGPIFLGKRYYPRGTIINENSACCGKGLPSPLPIPFLSAGSFLKERLKCCLFTSLAFETQRYYDFLAPHNLNFTPANLAGKTNLAPSNFDWYWPRIQYLAIQPMKCSLVNYLNV